MPVDIKELTDGWLELESDPGLFTLLMEDFGVKGVQVEEIYDLNKPLDNHVYGFIFLFRWVEERRSRRKFIDQSEMYVKDEEVVNNIFFAQQMVPNSCATHALISILLNCSNLHLGDTLHRLKIHTHGMSPENKGWAIGNTPELACAHNSHAIPQAKRRWDRTNNSSLGGRITTGKGEAFHFVSFVPIRGRLYELDGLKPYPIDHGPCGDHQEWAEKFRDVIQDRLGFSMDESNEIRFNLMAVVPDRRLALQHKLKMLRTNKQIVLDALEQILRVKKKKRADGDDGDEPASSPASSAKVEEEPSKKDDDTTSSTTTTIKEENNKLIDFEPSTSSSVQACLTLCPLDYATPLTIQTSPAPSNAESTDTPSDSGLSGFNSPTTQQSCWNHWAIQNSPSGNSAVRDLKRFVVLRMAEQEKNVLEEKSLKSSASTTASSGQNLHAHVHTSDGDPVIAEKKANQTILEPHSFAPKDLLALLRNLENEICVCEMSLKDENDKQNKYKIDDSRRTHNYDEFICTFLSMLAEQGKLADLVQQNLIVPKRPNNGGIPAPKSLKIAKKDQNNSPGKRNKKKSNKTKVKRRR